MTNDESKPVHGGPQDELAHGRMEMRRRHMRLGMQMQALAARGLDELRLRMERGQPLNLSADECKTLADAGLELEKSALPEGEIVAKKPS